MRYHYDVSMTHIFTSEETVSVVVEAENEEEAEELARKAAYDNADKSSFFADHDDTDYKIFDLTKVVSEEGEDTPPIRCDNTKDMFDGEAA